MVGLGRTVTALLLVTAGSLLHAASWQRWADACPFGSSEESRACDLRQDHLYDFLVVSEPWEPIGTAAQLAGLALLLVAVALVLLPWAVLGRAGAWPAVASAAGAATYADVGAATLRSGLAGEVVDPLLGGTSFTLWLLLPAAALVWLAVRAPGWTRACAVFLVLASPPVMYFSYAIGPFDANPWYEASCGDLTILGGLWLLVAAVRRSAVELADTHRGVEDLAGTR